MYESILIDSGLVGQADLNDAKQVARQYDQSVEKVLLATRKLSDSQFNNFQTVKNMIYEGILSRRSATDALVFCEKVNLGISEAVFRINSESAFQPTNSLENLIYKSALVTSQALNEARKISVERRISLCEGILVLKAAPFTHLNYVFECLFLLRQGRISEDAALKALNLVKLRNVDLSTALQMQGLNRANTISRIKLGDLLYAGSAISESELIGQLEKSFCQNRRFGETLTHQGVISPEFLHETLLLQKTCTNGLIDRYKASRIIRDASNKGVSISSIAISEGIFEDPDESEELLALLVEYFGVSNEEIKHAKSELSRFDIGAAKAMVGSGRLRMETYTLVVAVSRGIKAGEIFYEDAVEIFAYCQKNSCAYHVAITDLNLGVSQNRRVDFELKQSSDFSFPSAAKGYGRGVNLTHLLSLTLIISIFAFVLSLFPSTAIVIVPIMILAIVTFFLYIRGSLKDESRLQPF